MGFTDDWYTDGRVPSVFFSPTDFIYVTDGISPSSFSSQGIPRAASRN